MLTSFNPYVTAASPYSLVDGSLTVATKAAITNDRYDTQTHVTVHSLGLQGADTLFHQQFGIPLSTALALLTDLQGDIVLDVPVVVDHGMTQVDVGAAVRSALKGAIVGAVTSPLKLLGLGGGRSETVGSLEPPPLAMLPGRAEASDGRRRADREARGAARDPAGHCAQLHRPGRRRGRALVARAEATRGTREGLGIIGAVTGLPARNARKRIVDALGERASDGTGNLDSDDAALLAKWLEKEPAPTAGEVAALDKRRVERVIAMLRDDHGIEERRLNLVDAQASDPERTAPGVKVAIPLPR